MPYFKMVRMEFTFICKQTPFYMVAIETIEIIGTLDCSVKGKTRM